MVKLRPVTPNDVDLICEHRAEIFLEAGRDPTEVDAARASFRDWLVVHLADDRYFGFLAEDDQGQPIGGVGQMAVDWPPHPNHPRQSMRGYVLNVYVNRECRGQGIARALMRAAHEEFERRGIDYLYLHASAMGAPLYDQMGWKRSNEMVWRAQAPA